MCSQSSWGQIPAGAMDRGAAGAGAATAATEKVKCPMPGCGRLLWPAAMASHLRKIHGAGPNSEEPAVCLMCFKVITNGMLHNKCGRAEAVRCPVAGCEKVCASPDGVRSHVFAEHGSSITRLRREYRAMATRAYEGFCHDATGKAPAAGAILCTKCVPPRAFKTNKSWLKHTRTYHNVYKALFGCPTCLKCRAPTRRELMRRMRDCGCVGNLFCPVCKAEIRTPGKLGRARRGGLDLLVKHLTTEHDGFTAAPAPGDCLACSPAD